MAVSSIWVFVLLSIQIGKARYCNAAPQSAASLSSAAAVGTLWAKGFAQEITDAMSKYWIVVADAAKARLFARNKKFSPLEEIETLVHPESRLRRQDLVTDRPGQVQESRTPGESAAEGHTDPKDVEAQVFARELAHHLNESRQAGHFEHLVLLAEPRFLGILRKHLDGGTAKAVAGAEAVNLTRGSIEHIASAADSALE